MEKIGEEKQEQSFLEHLEVLRWHLIRSSAAVLLFTVLAFVFPLFDKIIFAAKDPSFATYRFFCWMSETLHFGGALCINEMPFELMNINMSGQFSTHIVSSVVAGLFCFSLYFWEIWRFVKPATS